MILKILPCVEVGYTLLVLLLVHLQVGLLGKSPPALRELTDKGFFSGVNALVNLHVVFKRESFPTDVADPILLASVHKEVTTHFCLVLKHAVEARVLLGLLYDC